jgi:hypothetical protein
VTSSRGFVEVLLGELGHAGAFAEILAQQSVGILVRTALPSGLGITEVDLDTGIDGELGC